jgi:hypothetical protein
MPLSLEGQFTAVLTYLQLTERYPRLLACPLLLSLRQAGSAIELADFSVVLDVYTP